MPLTIQVAPRQTKSGSYTSPIYTVPVNVSGVGTVQADIDKQDFRNPTKSLTMYIEYLLDGVWKPYIFLTWIGGIFPPHPLGDPDGYDMPGATVDLNFLAGKQIRARYIIPSPMKIGVVVTLP